MKLEELVKVLPLTECKILLFTTEEKIGEFEDKKDLFNSLLYAMSKHLNIIVIDAYEKNTIGIILDTEVSNYEND